MIPEDQKDALHRPEQALSLVEGEALLLLCEARRLVSSGAGGPLLVAVPHRSLSILGGPS